MTDRARQFWLSVLAVSAWVGLCTIAAYGFVVWCE